jgi:hypothetical protein
MRPMRRARKKEARRELLLPKTPPRPKHCRD